MIDKNIHVQQKSSKPQVKGQPTQQSRMPQKQQVSGRPQLQPVKKPGQSCCG